MDVCGICKGDGKSCLDCDGTPNGQKLEDTCGACLDPFDENFNTGCQSIGETTPSMIVAGVEGSIVIYGAGLETFTADVSCSLVSDGNTVPIETVRFSPIKSTIMGFHAAIETPGEYTPTCVFTTTDGKSVEKTSEQKFVVYGAPTVTAVIPAEANLGSIPKQVTHLYN